MRQVVVLSGKGGTGKTTLVACLATLAAPVVAVDADVDAANLALLLDGEDGPEWPFTSGKKALIDADRCTGCGACVPVCRFDAIAWESGDKARIRSLACEGCGACALVCGAQAISFEDNVAGAWRLRKAETGWLVHAALGVAQDSSGKLVAQVREEARNVSVAEGLPTVLIDGPPGVGCPVHAAVTGADEIVAVTEPTPAGEHDLERLLRLAKHFTVPARVVVNKWDLAPEGAARIEAMCAAKDVAVIGRIPFDRAVPHALAERRLPLGDDVSPETAAAFRAIAKAVGLSGGDGS